MLDNIEEATIACVLILACKVEAHRSTLNSIKESKDFDATGKSTQKHVCETSCSDKC